MAGEEERVVAHLFTQTPAVHARCRGQCMAEHYHINIHVSFSLVKNGNDDNNNNNNNRPNNNELKT